MEELNPRNKWLTRHLKESLHYHMETADYLEAAAHDIVRHAATATPPPGTPEPLSPRAAAPSVPLEPIISPTAPTMTALQRKLEEASEERDVLMVSLSDSENRVEELESRNKWLTRHLKECLHCHMEAADDLEAAAHDIVRHAATATPPPGTPEPLSPRAAAAPSVPLEPISPTAPTMTAPAEVSPVPPVARRKESGRRWSLLAAAGGGAVVALMMSCAAMLKK